MSSRILSLILLVFTAQTSFAAAITVDTTADNTTAGDGFCTLREAILNSNDDTDYTSGDCASGAGVDGIGFNIPGGGVHTIQVTSPLPSVTDSMNLTGNSQTGSDCESGVINIEINGSLAPAGPGLQISTSDTQIKGIVVNGFSGGVGIQFDGIHNFLGCSFIGTDASGMSAVPNLTGVLFSPTSDGEIGDGSLSNRNVISGNTSGVIIRGTAVVRGNLIGTDLTGTNPVANTTGIRAMHTSTIGSETPGEGNVIAFNSGIGIDVSMSSGISILQNRIHDNGSLGIDLNGDGVTANDALDADAGPNDLLNFPVITSAVESGGTITMDFELDVPAAQYLMYVFSNTAADPSGNGEGETYVAEQHVNHPGGGTQSFTATFPGSAGDILSLLLVEDPNGGAPYGSTSEFSGTHVVTALVPLVVNTTADNTTAGDGDCTLREAILNSNDDTDYTSGDCASGVGADVIEFNISGVGVQTIQLTSDLPDITDAVTIDGETQPGASCDPRNLLIEIDGSAIAASFGLNVLADNSTVRGLVINGFLVGVGVGFGGVNELLECSHIGTDATAIAADPNDLGVSFGGTSTGQIGDGTVAGRNVISGNLTFGIEFGSDWTVIGNYIGTDVTGTNPLPNGLGIFVRASGGSIGSTVDSEANIIAFNTGDGISVNVASDVAFLINSIHDNGDLGIDLNEDGVTANDPGDIDVGPNDLLNFPVITSATEVGGTITVDFDLDIPAGVYRVLFFDNTAADPSGNGEGETFAGGVSIIHTGSGIESFSTTFAGNTGDILSSIVVKSDPAYEETSEFSAVYVVTAGGILVNTTADNTTASDGDCTLREAILNANDDTDYTSGDCAAGVGDDTIEFNIPGVGPHTIILLSDLPTVSDMVFFDGTTQSGTTCDPRNLQVIIDGDNLYRGLLFQGVDADNSRILGLSFIKTTNAVYVNLSSGITMQCLNIGMGENETNIFGTSGSGIVLDGADGILIGGDTVAEANMITTLSGSPIEFAHTVSNTVVQGNRINVDFSGNVIGSSSNIYIQETTNSVIGGVNAGEGNVITASTSEGIVVFDVGSNDVSILGNSIYGNTGIGIDFQDDGVTANDAGDVDAGPNDLLNFPVITSATESGGTITVDFDLDVPAGDYRVEFFVNTAADPSGHGEGETLVGSASITHTGSGVESFSTSFSGSAGDILTATATEDSGGGDFDATSEFSAAYTVTAFTGPIVVNTQADNTNVADGDCTLREAILNANDDTDYTGGDCVAGSGDDTIEFNIPGFAPVKTIQPTADLPDITDTLVIDGESQPGASCDPRNLYIEIDGSLTASVFGLNVLADNSTVRGLIINGFLVGAGIHFAGANGLAECNHIGTDSSAMVADPNDLGIAFGGTSSGQIGDGTAAGRNIISGNLTFGIEFGQAWTVIGNYIGTDITGSNALPNMIGIFVNSTGGAIGSDNASDANIIAFNSGDGIAVNTATDVAFLINSIHSNGDLGIDLNEDGVTANDALDADAGPNDLLNFPVITSAVETGGTITMDFDLDAPAAQYLMYIFSNTAADPSGNGEGETYVIEQHVNHPGGGTQSFTATFPGSAGDILSLLLVEDPNGGAPYGATSEFSGTYTATAPAPLVVNTTADNTTAGDGNCTLREAINNANNDTDSTSGDCAAGNGADIIEFNIAGAGPHTITVSPSLPALTEAVTIDGETQPGADCDPRNLLIVIDGSSVFGGIGLYAQAADITIRGLVINGFSGGNAMLANNASNLLIECNHVGTDVTGMMADPNTAGIVVQGTTTGTIGGNTDAARNVISGNTTLGIHMATGSDVIVVNNHIGVDILGGGNISNGVGIYVSAPAGTVGSTDASLGNIIAHSVGQGICMFAGTTVSYLANSIHSNGDLGIDLDCDAVTANDPLDADAGVNDLLNFPEITSAVVNGANIDVNYDLDVPAGNYHVIFFRNTNLDPSGNGEGEEVVFQDTIAHAGGGSQSFSGSFAGNYGDFIAMTVTEDLGGGNYGATSEFSASFFADLDSDGDGVTDTPDLDDDNDGIPDNDDGVFDPDGDGLVNNLDLDSDNDGINDIIESGSGALDADGNGIVDGPVGTNGLPDAVETAPDSGVINYVILNTDGDSADNFLDLDSDNDSVSDLIEGGSGGTDANDNGVVDGPDADNDGIMDSVDGDDGVFGDLADPGAQNTDGVDTPDYIDLDSDNDTIFDIDEAGNGNLDADDDGDIDEPINDADGDGIADEVDDDDGVFGGLGVQTPTDTDGDGVNDTIDLDDDGDGIPDTDEGAVDADGDGVNNDLDLDSDNDGLNDVIEAGHAGLDVDGNGIVDGAVGLNGLADSVETVPDSGVINYAIANTDGDSAQDFLDLDSDNDTVSDLIEGGSGGTDADDNGVVDGPDADNDGIMDSVDGDDGVFGDLADPGAQNTDGVDTPDYIDLDSDNDTILDIDEVGNGSLDVDDDGDVDEPINDADGDGIADEVDDDDGVFGGLGVQTPTDTDGDGVNDTIDLDDDGDGIPDADEGAVDTDGDGVTNDLDLDSDNDGLNDLIEAGHAGLDVDGNGIVDGAVGLNGLADSVETVPDSGVINYTIANTDADGSEDFLDLDSDNDSLSDLFEGASGGTDADNNGVVDGPDADNDGIMDSVDGDDGVFGDLADPGAQNTDGVDTPDYIDLDSDNDTIFDIDEVGNGGLDVDDDGDIDNATDTDNDGIADVVDADIGVFGGLGVDVTAPVLIGFTSTTADETYGPTSAVNVTATYDENLGPASTMTVILSNGVSVVLNVISGVELSGTYTVGVTGSGEDAADLTVSSISSENVEDLWGNVQTGSPVPASPNNIADTSNINVDTIAPVLASGTINGVTVVLTYDETLNSGSTPANGDFTVTGVTGGANVIGVVVAGLTVTLTLDNPALPGDVVTLDYTAGVNPIEDDSVTDGNDAGNLVAQALVNLLNVDTDGDGVLDVNDLDDDGDGIPDTDEGVVDTDGDGIINSLDLDSDNDGLNDLIEAGHTGLDVDGNGIVDGAVGANGLADSVETAVDSGVINYVILNTDGDSVNNFLDLDSDNDTVSDLIEGGSGGTDVDDNGVVDGPDADNDGIMDSVDGDDGVFGDLADSGAQNTDGIDNPDYIDLDSDNDSTFDIDEVGNGHLDVDDDGDVDEPITDADGDGIADQVDADTGIFGGLGIQVPDDWDGDGINNLNDLDDDGDGIPDADEGALDPDDDGVTNDLDLDSDNDGINDIIESGSGAVDADGNGIVDGAVGANGLADSVETVPDSGVISYTISETDGDSVEDFLDLDSDNDTVSDLIEGGSGGTDADDNGVVDDPDADGDGIMDSVDGDDGVFGDLTDPGAQDTDGDMIPDYIDPDSDNDTILDIDEVGNGALDADDDGDVDEPINDADGDGIADEVDDDDMNFGGLGVQTPPDTDGDGVNDTIDLDDDGDGIPDADEGAVDTDGDGVNNDLDLDSDNDGINDSIESGSGATDADGNGIVDGAVGLNGLADAVETAPDSGVINYTIVDTDGDSAEDFLDLDSDNDSVSDLYEGGSGGVDADDNGVVDGPDADNDGIMDSVDGDDGVFGDLTDPGAQDTDGDTIPDYMDPDSDNDGLLDVDENGNGVLDADDDGDIDDMTDTDNDGVPDVVDEDIGTFGGLGIPDIDGDGNPNDADLDDDGDNISDAMEDSGPNGGDANDDGQLDSVQPNVATTEDNDSDSFVTVEIPAVGPCTQIDSLIVESESDQAVADALLDYPLGLINIQIPCAGTVTVTAYFHGATDLSAAVYRKFSPTGLNWYDMPGVTFDAVAIGPETVARAIFDLTDGGAGDDDGLANGVIVDPSGPGLPTGGSILVTKQTSTPNISKGEFAKYTVTVENISGLVLNNVSLLDVIPPGFKYVTDSAQLTQSGSTNPVAVVDGRPIEIGPFNLAIGETVEISYVLRPGSGIGLGTYTNYVAAVDSIGGGLSNIASANVEVEADPIFDETTVIGKVFHDRNGNGYQDDGEEGLAGMRLITVEGLTIETDAYGRYHVPAVNPGALERGMTFIIKIPNSSLPAGAEVTTENPATIPVTNGPMKKINFGVRFPQDSHLNVKDKVLRVVQAVMESVDRFLVSEAQAEGMTEKVLVWMTQDQTTIQPQLNVLAQDWVALDNGKIAQGLEFHVYTNYRAFIQRWDLKIYNQDDQDLSHPIAVVEGSGDELKSGYPIFWAGDANHPLEANTSLQYVLTVYGKDNRMDRTAPRSLLLASGAFKSGQPLDGQEIERAAFGQNNLAEQNIVVNGQRVRIHAQNVREHDLVNVDGNWMPYMANGQFIAEQIVPFEQTKEIIVNINGRQESFTAVPKWADLDMVALADLTVGQNDVSGHIETFSDSDNFNEDVFVDGRVAFFLKGKIQGKYLIKAHADTTEDDIDNLDERLSDKDPKSLFRHLDPDKYYPVYGDGSKVTDEVESQGAVYVRVEKDKSSAMWGNYQTDVTGTELARHNRGLYGAKVEYQTQQATQMSDPRLQAKVFVAEARTAQGHDEFLGTGGSLYYLRNTHISEGSESLWVEVRENDTDRVIQRVTLERGRDYEVDEIQGRIILSRPLSQTADEIAPTIITNQPLDGHDVYLLADYEYVPALFDQENMVAGGRVKGWVNDHVGIGATYISEERAGADDYELQGLDVTLKATKGTYVKLEGASSQENQTTGFESFDGGLTFGAISAGSTADEGDAYSVEARLDLDDVSDQKGAVSFWWKDKEEGFSTSTENTDQDFSAYGAEVLWDIFRDVQLGVRASHTEDGTDEDDLAAVQATYNPKDKRWDAGVEVRHVGEETSGIESDATLVGAKVGYDVLKNVNVYAGYQVTADNDATYADNDRAFVGAKAQVTEKLAVRGEAGEGDRGSDVKIGADYNYAQGRKAYTTASLSADEVTGEDESVLTVGQRQELSNQLEIYSENQFSNADSESQISQLYGTSYRLNDAWKVGASYQHGKVEDKVSSTTLDRDAVSLSAQYDQDDRKFSTKLEYRKDDNGSDKEQWVTTNRYDMKLNEEFTLQSKFNYALTEDNALNAKDGMLVESGVGIAYRPVDNDRLNMLGKYTFLYDLPSAGQNTSATDERSHTVALEALYDLTKRWTLGGKYAYKFSEMRLNRDAGVWFKNDLQLAAVSAQYHVTKKWYLLAEYKYLISQEAEDNRGGALVALYRQFGKNFKAGVGYNFADFNDDLTHLDYDYQGWFVKLIGQY